MHLTTRQNNVIRNALKQPLLEKSNFKTLFVFNSEENYMQV